MPTIDLASDSGELSHDRASDDSKAGVKGPSSNAEITEIPRISSSDRTRHPKAAPDQAADPRILAPPDHRPRRNRRRLGKEEGREAAIERMRRASETLGVLPGGESRGSGGR